MDFTIPDLLSPGSGPPSDMGVQTARATVPSGSAGGRKSFSAVLQGVREGGRRAETRSVDDGRYKADHKTRRMDAREQSPSSDHSEHIKRPTSHARGVDERRSSDTSEGDTKDSRTPLASSTEQSSGGSDVQGRTSESLSSVISPLAAAQAITQNDVRAEGEDFSATEESASPGQHSSEPQSHSRVGLLPPRTDSPGVTNAALTLPDSADASVLSEDQGISQHAVPTQAPDAPVILARNGTAPAPVGKPDVSVTGEASTAEETTRLEMRSAPPDSQLRSTLSRIDAIGSASVPVQVETMVPGGKPEIAKTDIMFREDIPFDRIASSETSGDEQPHQDTGGRILPVAPYGQGSSLEGDEGFTGFLGDHPSAQHDQPETNFRQQTAAADRLVSGEQPAESIMAGTHGRAVSSLPPPAPSTHSVGQVSPAVPTHDHAEQFARVMTRSVVFNVAQPDIGQVNIRVALTNDMVHTHLSVDRPEVGQFFINGQDRLQAAFQASGLDMGQFRVDIDRQSSGRSFNHGSSAEQGQTWNQGAQGHGTKWEQGLERQEDQRSSLYGLLNVVA